MASLVEATEPGERSYFDRSQEAQRLGIEHNLTPYARALLKCIYETDGNGNGCYGSVCLRSTSLESPYDYWGRYT